MKLNLLFCGVGGQGVVLASKLPAFAAIASGYYVKTTETIGMAQRGGSVTSHVRISDTPIDSPLLPLGTADVIYAFEPAEAVRALPYLSESGLVIVSSKAVKPVNASLTGTAYDGAEMIDFLKKTAAKLTVIDGDAAVKAIGTSKALNLVMLGAAIGAGAGGFTEEELKEAVTLNVNSKFVELNLRALSYGVSLTKAGK